MKKQTDKRLVFTYGYPAAGKTTLAKKLVDDFGFFGQRTPLLISADKVRERLYGSQDNYGDPEEVWHEILKEMIAELKQPHSTVIYDAANLLRSYRLDYLEHEEIKEINPIFNCVRVNTPKHICRLRHEKRLQTGERSFGMEAFEKLLEIDEPPRMEEGWDEITDYPYLQALNKIYIASPFFKEEERNNVLLVSEILRKKGYSVFVPLEHKIPNAWDYPNHIWGAKVFDNDVKAIKASDVVIVLSYGRESSGGTNWEAGYAYGSGKNVVVVEMKPGTLMSIMVANGRVATLRGIKEVENYNFQTLPFKDDTETEQK